MPDQTISPPVQPSGIGAAILRREDKRFLMGRGNYPAERQGHP